MVALADILRRFRFHGVPGPPGALGVPAARGAEMARELEPVFAVLDHVQRTARDLVAAAERDAAHVRSEANERARHIVAEAREGAGRARDDAAASQLAIGDAKRAQLMAAGQRESERIARAAAARMPDACRSLLEMVLSSLPDERPPARAGGRRAEVEGRSWATPPERTS